MLETMKAQRVQPAERGACAQLPASCRAPGARPLRSVIVATAGRCQRGSGCRALTRAAAVKQQQHSHLQALQAALVTVPSRKTAGGGIQEATAQEVLARVAQHTASPTPQHQLLLMFTVAWCGPCSLVLRELRKLEALRARETFTVLVVDVDEDQNKELATQLGIGSLPTLVFVGQDTSRPTICTVGPVSARLVADVMDHKMSVCGADLTRRLRLS